MTYQQKYEELFKAYESAAKKLAQSRAKLEDINGFGDMNVITDYYVNHRNHSYAEREFQKLLQYSLDSKIDPETEYNTQEYIYNYIKKDQQKRGVPWSDEQVAPQAENGISFILCEIGLTNNPEVKKMYPGVEYKFPVLNLSHGKECYDYLVKMLNDGGGEDYDIEKLNFKGIVDEAKPLFIRVEMDIR